MGWVMKRCENCGWQGERSGQARKCIHCGAKALVRLPCCDFMCGRYDEPVIEFYNTNGHRWVCHLTCLRQQLEVNEILAEESKEMGYNHEGVQVF